MPARRRPASPLGPGGRAASGHGRKRPTATTEASASLIAVGSSEMPALASVIRSTEAAAIPSTGAAASTDSEFCLTRAGRSGASASPGARTSAASDSSGAGRTGGAEERLERHDHPCPDRERSLSHSASHFTSMVI